MNFRVATLNIRNSEADDGPNSWVNRANSLCEFLGVLNADILGLQEVMADQLDKICTVLTEHEWVGAGRIDGGERGEFAPVFFKRNSFEFVESRRIWLSDTPDVPGSKSWNTACERLCEILQLRIGFNDLMICNTHLDHVSHVARQKGIELILENMSRNPVPSIFLGDLNATDDEARSWGIEACGFKNSLPGNETPTYHDFGKEDGRRIDYIFYRDLTLLDSWIESARWQGRYVSDHNAVVAEFQV